MRRVCLLAFILALGMPAGLQAQRRGQGPANRAELQQRIVHVFVTSFREQAGLSDEQFERFREEVVASFERRHRHHESERELWDALGDQLRPGVAADTDSVAALVDGIFQSKQRFITESRAEFQRYGEFLNPVQQGLLMVHWERFNRRIENIRMGRGMGGPPGGAPF